MKWDEKRSRIVLILAVVGLGLVHTVAARNSVNPDGLSYIEIAQSYLRGDWHSVLSAYWSPLYAWFIATTLWVFKPSLFWESSVVHGVNFLIFVGSFFAFRFLLNELEKSSPSREAKIPFEAVRLIGYLIFLVSSLGLIRIALVTPDMLVALFVYLISALSLRFCRNASFGSASLLGVALAFGYFAKTILFPIGVIFLIAIALSKKLQWFRALKIGFALFIFLGISALYIIPLSRDRGYITVGDSGRLVYSWQVNKTTQFVHWQGDSQSGMPIHATKKIMDAPALFEFRSPIGGTYAPWFDPAYWNQGMKTYFNLENQLGTFFRNIRGMSFLIIYNFLPLVLILFVFFWLGEHSAMQFIKRVLSRYVLLIPALSGLVMYLAVSVEGRYVAPFLTLFWVAILAEIPVSKSLNSTKAVHSIIMSAASILGILVFLFSGNDARDAIAALVTPPRVESPQWQIAEGLRAAGIKPGDEIGVISQYVAGFESYWAHLAGVRIVAELPPSEINTYWFASDETKNNVLETFEKVGIRAVVMEQMQGPKPLAVWQQVGDTGYYVYLFSQKN